MWLYRCRFPRRTWINTRHHTGGNTQVDRRVCQAGLTVGGPRKTQCVHMLLCVEVDYYTIGAEW